MSDKGNSKFSRLSNANIVGEAFRYSIPLLLGYVPLGIAFGLMVSSAGYPWWLALVMSCWIYTGAGQFVALGLLAAGAGPGRPA